MKIRPTFSGLKCASLVLAVVGTSNKSSLFLRLSLILYTNGIHYTDFVFAVYFTEGIDTFTLSKSLRCFWQEDDRRLSIFLSFFPHRYQCGSGSSFFFISMRILIRIQGAKRKRFRIRVRLKGKTKIDFFHEKYTLNM